MKQKKSIAGLLRRLEAGALAVAACLLATCIPLRRISKMSVVEAIEAVE